VYDITNRQTFKYLSSWLEECRTNADEAAVIVLVGNKSMACSALSIN
jgi:GTPase SAR1 family protein